MSLTYTWKVTGLKIKQEAGFNNAVVQTYWAKIGTDEDGNEGKFNGATPFTVDPDQPTFIPFDQLTEADVLGWVQGVVVGDYELHVNEQIAKDLESKLNPDTEISKIDELPWSNNE